MRLPESVVLMRVSESERKEWQVNEENSIVTSFKVCALH